MGRRSSVVAPSVVWWLQGDRAPDPDLPAGAEVIAGPGVGEGRMVVAAGADRRRRLHAASAAMAPPRLLVTPIPGTTAQWDAVVRQATLWECGVILEADGSFGPEARDRVERACHLAWAVVSALTFPWPTFRGPGRTSERWASAGDRRGVGGRPSGLAVSREYALERGAALPGGSGGRGLGR